MGLCLVFLVKYCQWRFCAKAGKPLKAQDSHAFHGDNIGVTRQLRDNFFEYLFCAGQKLSSASEPGVFFKLLPYLSARHRLVIYANTLQPPPTDSVQSCP